MKIKTQKYQIENSKKVCTIYCITNILNNKQYIGYTSYNGDYRYTLHISASLGTTKPKDSKQHIHNAISKHGISNFKFDIIYQTYDDEHCMQMETHFIKEYNTFGGTNGYNHTMGGEDRRRSEATRKKHSQMMKGRKQTPEHCKNKGIALSGKNNGMFGKKLDMIRCKELVELSKIAHKIYRQKFTYYYIDIWGNIFETKSKEFLINLMGVKNWDGVKNTLKSPKKFSNTKRNTYKFKNGYKFVGCFENLYPV